MSKKKSPKFVLRTAKMDDVRPIHSLLNFFADRRELLPRSLSEIYENLQQFFVVAKGNEIIGCCALYVTWSGLAEVKALAVREEYQGRGYGKKLLQRVIKEAKALNVDTLFTLTIRDRLFEKYGFKRTKKSELPHKVWTECVKCPYFPEACIETSLTLDLKPRKKGKLEELTRSFMSSSDPSVPNEPTTTFQTPPPIRR